MVNNRITFATAQLSIKDNRADATTNIMGVLADGTLGSGISDSATGTIHLNESLSGVWPSTGQVRIKTGSNATEYVRYTGFLNPSGLIVSERGTGETTAAAHNANDVVQLLGWEVPLGVQSVSIGTTFNTEDKFQIGQLEPIENIEGIPDVEVSIEKCLDGTKPLWLITTDFDQTTFKGRTADYTVDVALSVYPDTQDSATGTPDSTVVASGMVISSWSVSMPTDDNFIESVTLVGNDKTWGGEEGVPSGFFPTADSFAVDVVGSGVQRSEDFDLTATTFPASVPTPDHFQSVEVSVDITREDIFELGRKTPFFRSVSFPVTVTTTFESITDKGDLVNAIGHTGEDNLSDETILIKLKSGFTIDLGSKNKLSSTTFEGFDAGGGNGTVTYEYTNSNALTISHTGFPDAFDLNTDLTHS